MYQYNSGNGQWNKAGSDIHGKVEYDRFGESVSLTTTTTSWRLAIGAPGWQLGSSSGGFVRIVEFGGSNDWETVGSEISSEGVADGVGKVVSLSSDGSRVGVVATGAETSGSTGSGSTGRTLAPGHASVFEFISGGDWTRISDDLDLGNSAYLGDTSDETNRGYRMAMSTDGSRLVASTPADPASGVRVFKILQGVLQGTQGGVTLSPPSPPLPPLSPPLHDFGKRAIPPEVLCGV